jgi:rhodanese-related sulfurtransferase
MSNRRSTTAIAILIAIGALLPPVLYWVAIGRIPNMDPIAASDYIRAAPADTLLVDVRDPIEFRAAHLEGAASLPASQIASLATIGDLPPALTGTRLLLICNGGVSSAQAAARLRALGLADAWNVTGGLQSWIAAGETPGYPAITTIRPPLQSKPRPSLQGSSSSRCICFLQRDSSFSSGGAVPMT